MIFFLNSRKFIFDLQALEKVDCHKNFECLGCEVFLLKFFFHEKLSLKGYNCLKDAISLQTW